MKKLHCLHQGFSLFNARFVHVEAEGSVLEVKGAPRKSPDAPLGKIEGGDALTQSSLDDMTRMERNDEAEILLKDSAKTEKMVSYMLGLLTDKKDEQRSALGLGKKAQEIIKLVGDEGFHELFVACAITKEHGDDVTRRESVNKLVNALINKGKLDQTFVAQLEKAKVTGSQVATRKE